MNKAKKMMARVVGEWNRMHRLYNPFSSWYRRCRKAYQEAVNGLKQYCVVTEEVLFSGRKSDTCVILGCGASLKNITTDQWEHLSGFDTIGFNWIIHQDFVDLDYLFIREIMSERDILSAKRYQEKTEEYLALLRSSRNTKALILLQHEFSSVVTNNWMAAGILPKENRYFLFHAAHGTYNRPTCSFREGLVHHTATLSDVLNMVYIMGWKKVILAGIDLYDQRYFWLADDQTRTLNKKNGYVNTDRHKTADGVLDLVSLWGGYFQAAGVELWVVNSRSLLTKVLPVYAFDMAINKKETER